MKSPENNKESEVFFLLLLCFGDAGEVNTILWKDTRLLGIAHCCNSEKRGDLADSTVCMTKPDFFRFVRLCVFALHLSSDRLSFTFWQQTTLSKTTAAQSTIPSCTPGSQLSSQSDGGLCFYLFCCFFSCLLQSLKH